TWSTAARSSRSTARPSAHARRSAPTPPRSGRSSRAPCSRAAARMGACVLGFAAGALGTLSPCVLPLLPLVIAGAIERHRPGPLVLAAGLAGSATIVGLGVALL